MQLYESVIHAGPAIAFQCPSFICIFVSVFVIYGSWRMVEMYCSRQIFTTVRPDHSFLYESLRSCVLYQRIYSDCFSSQLRWIMVHFWKGNAYQMCLKWPLVIAFCCPTPTWFYLWETGAVAAKEIKIHICSGPVLDRRSVGTLPLWLFLHQ